MKKVWLIADAAVSSLGSSSDENFHSVFSGTTGVKQNNDFGDVPIFVSHLSELAYADGATRFEQLALRTLSELRRQVKLPTQRTLFILSSTKGNIEVVEEGHQYHPRIHLHAVATWLAKQVGIEKSIVVSNACISGVAAILVAKRFIDNRDFDHAIVLGVDVLTNFVISGFKSLQAMSHQLCKPFDLARTGINLGEAGAAVLLTSKPFEYETRSDTVILGGAIRNDANHISGPSKTGVELAAAIGQALTEANKSPAEIDFISAHGTATLYNDEMESKAFHLNHLSEVPLHSLKGNFGHTLGAAGVLETVMCAKSLQHHQLLPTYGYEKHGVSQPLNISKKSESRSVNVALKTASGFGGCNAALVMAMEH